MIISITSLEGRGIFPLKLRELLQVAVAGRVMARRVMGKLAFISIQDDSGLIQLYVEKKEMEAQEAGSFA